ncbi:MAG: hypothetical protein KOO63_06100 [Bacteroidales bacterium]|nr:hypothetical protein [Candidatus Latescibacterota bacterium]
MKNEKKQHVEIERKLTLRKSLLEKVGPTNDAVYVPFIGDGDIATALYSDRKIFGADNDPARVNTASKRLPSAVIIEADCDRFPFNKSTATFDVADFDAYSYPYDSFRKFWEGAKIAPQCVIFFTDGQRQAIIRTGHYRTPDGEKHILTKTDDKRKEFNFYFNKTLLPWFIDYIKPWTLVYSTKYLRDPNQLYWGAIIIRGNDKTLHNEKEPETPDTPKKTRHPYKFDDIKKAEYLKHLSEGHQRGYAATLVGVHRSTISDCVKADKKFAEAVSYAEADAVAKVENALFEAANSGNVTAIQVYLYNRDPKRWADRRNIHLAGAGGGPIKVEHDLSDEQLTEIIKSRGSGGTSKETPSP